MWQFFVVLTACVCGLQAIQSKKLSHSALWLALTSGLVSLLIYLLGAPQIAVIELSVGAGVVTILLVFAINIVGDQQEAKKPLVPKAIAILVVFGIMILISSTLIPIKDHSISVPETVSLSLSEMMWQDRFLDTLLQIILIFTCVLGTLILMEDRNKSKEREK
ncbi:MAG: NADH-quinone oxidoreductase subunit J [Anaerolineaceae bacterium]|nr:NADH-quinone oxidoreductase subunit J [Anaerolineaceae bacterium]